MSSELQPACSTSSEARKKPAKRRGEERMGEDRRGDEQMERTNS